MVVVSILIKVFSFIILALGETSSIIFAVNFAKNELSVFSILAILIGSLSSLFLFSIVYGFGELVNNSQKLREEFEDFCEDNEKNFHEINNQLEILCKKKM